MTPGRFGLILLSSVVLMGLSLRLILGPVEPAEGQVVADPVDERAYVRRFLLMDRIIFCESRHRFVTRRDVKGEDVGLWQISTRYHKNRALVLGLDIYDPEDNFQYGLYLFETEGVRPWRASQHCWG